MCGEAQRLSIKKTSARTPRMITYWRKKLREHVQGCTFCQKELKKRRR